MPQQAPATRLVTLDGAITCNRTGEPLLGCQQVAAAVMAFVAEHARA
jgi:hypothetical protein